MIVHRKWTAKRMSKLDRYKVADAWTREGWFLFGFIPLYIRDLHIRKEL